MVLVVVVGAKALVIGMRRVGEHLVGEEDSAGRSQHTGDLGHAALYVNPVVHRVHRPDGIDDPVIDRGPLCSIIGHLDVGAAPAEHATHLQHPTHEWRGLDGNHVGASPRGAHRSRTHTGSDVDHPFACLGVDQVDNGIVYG